MSRNDSKCKRKLSIHPIRTFNYLTLNHIEFLSLSRSSKKLSIFNSHKLNFSYAIYLCFLTALFRCRNLDLAMSMRNSTNKFCWKRPAKASAFFIWWCFSSVCWSFLWKFNLGTLFHISMKINKIKSIQQ
jgi:hypothetical protein